jgi:UPF0755 protein
LKKALLALALLVILVATLAGGYLSMRAHELAEFAQTPYGQSARIVEIPAGGPHVLAKLLAKEGVVSDADLFYRYVRQQNATPKLKHGEYEFEAGMTPAQVLAKIVSGQQKTYRFTIPEGLRVDEILPLLAASELHLDSAKLDALARDKAFFHKLGVPADSIEGFLYPDTYTFTRGFTEQSVLTKMVQSTLEHLKKAEAHRKAGVKLDPLQTMTLASIIEKETAAPEERPRISCVFHNRLRLGMRLGTDPTVLYAMMLLRGHFVKNITKADLTTPHPYNTYMVKGLPPGPIANPGEPAMEAALNPLDCSDLYFVSRNNGTHVFCPDLKCHEAAVEKWQVEYFRQKKHEEAQRK